MSPVQHVTAATRCVWSYPLEPNLSLKLLSTADQVQAEQSKTYHLQLGDVVTWDVPASFAERLQEAHKLLRE